LKERQFLDTGREMLLDENVRAPGGRTMATVVHVGCGGRTHTGSQAIVARLESGDHVAVVCGRCGERMNVTQDPSDDRYLFGAGAASGVAIMYHVSSVANRASIELNGLDWRLMKFAPGIAGSLRPEVDGVFLCIYRDEADWFVDLNNTGDEVDVWAVEGITRDQLIDNGRGYFYYPGTIRADAVRRL
jgi:hypothetical protein